MEKKKRKILEKQQQQMKEAEIGLLNRDTINVEEVEKSQTGDESEDDVEIVEDENGNAQSG